MGVLQAALGLRPAVLALRRVAAQREDVLDAGVAHLVERAAQLVDRGADAGEVRHRLQAVLALDARDDVDRLVARASRRRRRSPRRSRARAARARAARARGSPRPRRSSAGRTRRRTTGSSVCGSGARRCARRQTLTRLCQGCRSRRSTAPGSPRRCAIARPGRPRGGAGSRASRSATSCAFIGVSGLAVDARDGVEGGQRAVEARARRAAGRRARATSARLASMWPRTSVNVRPWPDRHRRAPRSSTRSSERRNSPAGSGRVAVVVVERDAAEQVVAADQQPALGLAQAHVRGRVAGRLDDLPGAEVGLELARRRRRSRSGSTSRAIPDGAPRRASM